MSNIRCVGKFIDVFGGVSSVFVKYRSGLRRSYPVDSLPATVKSFIASHVVVVIDCSYMGEIQLMYYWDAPAPAPAPALCLTPDLVSSPSFRSLVVVRYDSGVRIKEYINTAEYPFEGMLIHSPTAVGKVVSVLKVESY